MSCDTSRPGEGRAAPGLSFESGASAEASLTCVSRPVFASSASVVTTAVSSFSR